ncbi:MAG: radical SAM protein [Chitinophagaceae bacterium]|nr:radical SAM protein [Chitinophagaceae bacterium]
MESRKVDIVIKVSKYCNLRCTYCYEFPDLGNKHKMSTQDFAAIARNIYNYYQKCDFNVCINFIWHGGEPLLVHPDFYYEMFEIQKKIFCTHVTCTNTMQTNLTVLDEARIQLIKDLDLRIGVSIDLVDSVRVYKSGKESQSKVLKNMDILHEHGIHFGCIVVLNKNTLGREKEVFDFFYSTKTSFSVLPLFPAAFDTQLDEIAVSNSEIIQSLRKFAQLYNACEKKIGISPITDFFSIIESMEKKDPVEFYDKEEWCPVILVNTNGDYQGYGDPYGSSEYIYGNLIHDTFDQPMFGSQNYSKSLREAKKRIAYNCVNCKYFGYCDGYYIAEVQYDNVTNSSLIKICEVTKMTLTNIEEIIVESQFITGVDYL